MAINNSTVGIQLTVNKTDEDNETTKLGKDIK